jgi:hypothetical protein
MPRVAVRPFLMAVEANNKVSLSSPNGSVDQRKSPSWQPRIGAPVQRRQCPLWGQKQISRGGVDRHARADDARSDESGLHGFVTPFFTTTA